MRCFWEHGFGGASVAVLEEAAGINRRQLSRDYGNKRGLFLQALEDFTSFAGQLYLERMERKGAGRDAIAATLRDLARLSQAPLGHLGCLVCNTSREPITQEDDEVRQAVHAFFSRIENAYLSALRGAANAGEIAVESRQLRAAARHLLAVHISLLVLARSRMPAPVLADVARRALDSLG